MKYLSVILLLFLSGCVIYPINKTLQPEAEITVTDSDGKPIEDAWISLISNAFPYGFEKGRMKKKTRYQGKASFPGISEWRTESTMMHGSEIFFWNWCIVKEGYETHITAWRSSDDFIRNC